MRRQRLKEAKWFFQRTTDKLELWGGLSLPIALTPQEWFHCDSCISFMVLSEHLPGAPLLPVPAAFVSFSLLSCLPLLACFYPLGSLWLNHGGYIFPRKPEHHPVCGHWYFGVFFSQLEAVKGPREETDFPAIPHEDGQCLILLRPL